MRSRALTLYFAPTPFDIINAKFESTYVKRGYDPPWYEAYARSAKSKLSIRKISHEIGHAKEYTHIYSPFSGVNHGSDMWKSIAVGDQGLLINPIREPQNVPQVEQLAATLALQVFRIVIRSIAQVRKRTSTGSTYKSGALAS